MNNPHQNARTTVHGLELMVARCAEGRPVSQIAAELGVSSRTAFKWLGAFAKVRAPGFTTGRVRPSDLERATRIIGAASDQSTGADRE